MDTANNPVRSAIFFIFLGCCGLALFAHAKNDAKEWSSQQELVAYGIAFGTFVLCCLIAAVIDWRDNESTFPTYRGYIRRGFDVLLGRKNDDDSK